MSASSKVLSGPSDKISKLKLTLSNVGPSRLFANEPHVGACTAVMVCSCRLTVGFERAPVIDVMRYELLSPITHSLTRTSVPKLNMLCLPSLQRSDLLCRPLATKCSYPRFTLVVKVPSNYQTNRKWHSERLVPYQNGLFCKMAVFAAYYMSVCLVAG